MWYFWKTWLAIWQFEGGFERCLVCFTVPNVDLKNMTRENTADRDWLHALSCSTDGTVSLYQVSLD